MLALLVATAVPDVACAFRMALGFPSVGYIAKTFVHKPGYIRPSHTCECDNSAWHAKLIGSMRKRGTSATGQALIDMQECHAATVKEAVDGGPNGYYTLVARPQQSIC